jgi:hypothetical protein
VGAGRQPAEVNAHDFPSDAVGWRCRTGLRHGREHRLGQRGYRSRHRGVRRRVGAPWWRQVGADAYPHATRLLVTADSGGSNGSRLRLWKAELARFADETGLAITVTHLPPGTSKWNKIEHRLFSHISMNWRGRPLSSHEVVVNTIAATTTRTGLSVKAVLDDNSYPTGLRITDVQMRACWTGISAGTSFIPTGTTTCTPPPTTMTKPWPHRSPPTRPNKRK